MAEWTPFVLSYLFGMATPVFLVRQLLRRRGDSGACIMEIFLAGITALILTALWFGLG